MIEKPIKISTHLIVGPQPDRAQLEELAKSGVKTVINLSKKGEFNQTLKPEEEKEVVKELGLKYVHEPISVRDMKSTMAGMVCEMLAGAEKPVYLHCCFGQRSGTLGFIYHALRRKLSAEKTLDKATKLGVDLTAPIFRTIVTAAITEAQEARQAGAQAS